MLKDIIDLYKLSQVVKVTKNKMCIKEAMDVVYHLNEYEPFDKKANLWHFNEDVDDIHGCHYNYATLTQAFSTLICQSGMTR